jgi:hypothetical protein
MFRTRHVPSIAKRSRTAQLQAVRQPAERPCTETGRIEHPAQWEKLEHNEEQQVTQEISAQYEKLEHNEEQQVTQEVSAQ